MKKDEPERCPECGLGEIREGRWLRWCPKCKFLEPRHKKDKKDG